MAFVGKNPHLGAAAAGAPLISFAAGDATPDVSQGTSFATANVGSTTITAFDGASEGQIFTVLLDANTTIDSSANALITGNAGNNVSGAAGTVIACRHINGVTRILSISVAA